MSLPLRRLACLAAIGITLLGCILPNLALLVQEQDKIEADIAAGTVIESNAAAFQGEALDGDGARPYGVLVCAPIMFLGLLATLPIFIKAWPRR